MKFLAVDYGQKRIGLAIGSMFPKALGTVLYNGDSDTVIQEIISKVDDEVAGVVVGIPYLESGDEGRIGSEIREFAMKLAQAMNTKLYFEPEQYSSLESLRLMSEQGTPSPKKHVDEGAACIILEQFLGRVEAEGIENLMPAWEPFDNTSSSAEATADRQGRPGDK
ncbi:MAG TPA: Holliday junction resolvase RuvX [bacterium]|nr:Holliday junction resolvase RuvX [bacterium]